MDKPEPVLTGSIDDELITGVLTAYERDPHHARQEIETAVADYRQKIETELWQAWEIAQGFNFDQDRTRVLQQQRVLEERQDSFHRAVRRYNRHVIEHHAQNPEEEAFPKHEGCSEPECGDCDAEAAEKNERAARAAVVRTSEETVES
jgi:hemerythrin superfamily protein